MKLAAVHDYDELDPLILLEDESMIGLRYSCELSRTL